MVDRLGHLWPLACAPLPSEGNMANIVRALVSKKKLRHKEDGFDLDLSYVTPRVSRLHLLRISMTSNFVMTWILLYFQHDTIARPHKSPNEARSLVLLLHLYISLFSMFVCMLVQLIAMGYPSDKFEGIYRNRMTDVKRFFHSKHDGHFKV